MLKLCAAFLCIVLVSSELDADSPDADQVHSALSNATAFMVDTVADHGGYAWVSSADGVHSNGEGVAGPDRVWVQPPGTPAIGLAFLDAYEATGDEIHLNAAKAAANSLIQGQLRSGGWGYSIEFDPKLRRSIPYRVEPQGNHEKIAPTPKPGGWDIWRKRKFTTNQTLIDDDTTPAAIRFLARLDKTLRFKDDEIHDAAMYALRSTLGAQYPIGAWGHNYDRFPFDSPSISHYPVSKSSYPETWTRRSQNDFNGCYMLNDRATMNMIETMLLAAEIYDDDRYRHSAIRGGEFLLLAQLPDPQPAWAQQYDRLMHPVWDRKFEPPAITARESQDVLRTLLVLFEATQDRKFLKPIPPAIAYLKTCLRNDGKLARFYELKSNKPVYFNKNYELTYDDREMPDHYGFVVDSTLAEIESEYEQVTGKSKRKLFDDKQQAKLQADAERILRDQNDQGAWLSKGFVRDLAGRKVTPQEGVVESETFIENVRTLATYLKFL